MKFITERDRNGERRRRERERRLRCICGDEECPGNPCLYTDPQPDDDGAAGAVED